MSSIDITGLRQVIYCEFVGAYLTIVLCYTIEFTYDYFNGYIKVLGVYMGMCLYRGGNEFKLYLRGGQCVMIQDIY